MSDNPPRKTGLTQAAHGVEYVRQIAFGVVMNVAGELRVCVRLPFGLADKVLALARDRQTTVSAVVRSAIEDQGKAQVLIAKMEQVLQALERNGARPPGLQAKPSHDEDAGLLALDAVAGGDPQPMDEATLARTMRNMLTAFGGDEEE